MLIICSNIFGGFNEMIIMKLIYPLVANRFSSVVVITFASHAKGPGFDPQLNHYFFSSVVLLILSYSVQRSEKKYKKAT